MAASAGSCLFDLPRLIFDGSALLAPHSVGFEEEVLAFIINDPAIADPLMEAAGVGMNLVTFNERNGLTAPEEEGSIIGRERSG